MASTVVAIDIGSGYVKAATHLSDAKKRLAFSSVVGEIPDGFRGAFGTEDVRGPRLTHPNPEKRPVRSWIDA